ncbi:hypothetical protein ACFL5V_04075 [Fibrobacterota bacterium]
MSKRPALINVIFPDTMNYKDCCKRPPLLKKEVLEQTLKHLGLSESDIGKKIRNTLDYSMIRNAHAHGGDGSTDYYYVNLPSSDASRLKDHFSRLVNPARSDRREAEEKKGAISSLEKTWTQYLDTVRGVS